MTSVRILAPAKVNIGLAIIGKRPDGYHDIDTIMAIIDLYDEITISDSQDDGISIDGMDDVPVESNLMTKAAKLWCDATGIEPRFHIDITKRIPTSAGIGGGSSDAVAVLRALTAFHGNPLSEEQLHQIAAELGADCPFFLQGPTARATGIGTELRKINLPKAWLTLVAPRIKIENKTARLYGSITPEDFKSAETIDAIERGCLNQMPLQNSFLRAALGRFPGLAGVHQLMQEVAGNVSLSGAGPSLYAVATSQEEADSWATKIRAQLREKADVFVVSILREQPEPEVIK